MKNSIPAISLSALLSFAASSCSWLVGAASTFAQDQARPNIIYVLADDLGWTDLGCQGSKYYETPNIDRLASQGMRFLQYHNCQNCQPTRAALMTGQYAARTGIYTVGGIDRFEWSQRPLRPVDNVTKLPLDKVTIAQLLKQNGYATGMFGKWHLGNDGDYHPGRRGFDEAIESSGVHFDFKTTPNVDYPKGTYLADFLTDKAVDFIDRHRGHPFFLYLPHFGVHSPLQAKKSLIEKFSQKQGMGGHKNPTYAAMIASVDESVGRILETLEKHKLTNNTLVVFSSDNGGVGGYAREGIQGGGDTTDNTPLRSGKGSLYEGGTLVPFIARWPGNIPAGTTCATPAIHVDVFPTLAAVAGIDAFPDQPQDGESLLPLFKNPEGKLKREAIYQHFPGYLGAGKEHWRTTPVGLIQMGDWKLMEFFEDHRFELYHLGNDLGETQNLASSQPEKLRELQSKMNAWRATVQAPMPTPNQPGDQPSAAKGKGQGKKKNAAKKKGKNKN